MKGKKTDSEFVTNFISSCAGKNLFLKDEICQSAKDQILEIDNKIKDIKNLKILRSKLLDVLVYLDANKIEVERPYSDFWKIEYYGISSFIANCVDGGETSLEEVIDFMERQSTYPCKKEEIIFSIKQLIEKEVITKDKNILGKGNKFDEYLKFLEGGF